jgi:hypothetical protein
VSIFDEAALAEFGIEAAAGEEIDVLSAFRDAATLKDEDLVGMAHSGKAMGYDEAGPVFHEVVESLLDEALGGGVHTGGGLVEDKDGRIFEECPGNGEALFLTDAEFDSPLAKGGVQALWKAPNEIGGIGGAEDLPDFLLGGIGFSDAEVFRSRSVEHEALLGHDGDAVPEVGFRDFAQGDAIDSDFSAREFVEAHQKVDDG